MQYIMKKFLRIYLYFIIIILLTSQLYSYEKYVDFDLLKKEEPPRFIENGILFTLRGEEGTNDRYYITRKEIMESSN